MLNLLWMLFKGFLRWKQKLIWNKRFKWTSPLLTQLSTWRRGWSACIVWLCDCLGITKSHYVILKYFHSLFVPTKGCWNCIHVFLQAQLYAWGLHHKGYPVSWVCRSLQHWGEKNFPLLMAPLGAFLISHGQSVPDTMYTGLVVPHTVILSCFSQMLHFLSPSSIFHFSFLFVMHLLSLLFFTSNLIPPGNLCLSADH